MTDGSAMNLTSNMDYSSCVLNQSRKSSIEKRDSRFFQNKISQSGANKQLLPNKKSLFYKNSVMSGKHGMEEEKSS